MSLLELIDAGVVLTPAVPEPVKLLLAPVALVHRGRLYFYDLVGGRARTLKFEREEWEHERCVWLVQAGDRVASLAPVADESVEASSAWRRRWLDLPAIEQAQLRQRFQSALEALLD